MARPRKAETAKNRPIRMTEDDWAKLGEKAENLGFRGRAELVRAIVHGQDAVDGNRRAIVLGESVPG